MDPLQDTHRQLAAMRGGLKGSNPDLYRHLALYLQVLRDGLLEAIQQACFRLATQIHPDRYCQLPSARRRELHERMADLSRRACSLLTVEQVAAMAAQIARAERRAQRERHSRLMEELQRAQSATSADPGSIHLGMAPPIDPGLSLGLFPGGRPEAAPEGGEASPPQSRSGDQSSVSAPSSPGDTLDGLLAAMAEALQSERFHSEPLPSGVGEPERDPTESEAPWNRACLPDDPLQLLQWLEGFDDALARRLRNLSHALNVDCLRMGITQGLLPVGLLDAALHGQVDQLPAPPNLLRLQIPAGTVGSEGPIALVAVLLRVSDLELENPRLRTCRQRLQQHRQEVNRMAQTYRRVQRRLKTLEAERLWLEDNHSSRSGSAAAPDPSR